MTGLAKLRLDDISTCWPEVNDPLRFTMRYAPAIHVYLRALIRNVSDAEDVLQDFLLNVVRHCFKSAQPDKGRFRDYLKAAVQRAASAYYRGRANAARFEQLDAWDFAEPAHVAGEQQWLVAWRDCLLERAWERLWRREQESRGACYYTVLKLATESPERDSQELADAAGAKTGRSMTATTCRQQLSRARREFSRLLCEEVAETIRIPTTEAIREELGDLGLLCWLEKHLPG